MLTLGTEIFHDNDAGKSKVPLHHTVSLFCIVTEATTKKIKLITHLFSQHFSIFPKSYYITWVQVEASV